MMDITRSLTLISPFSPKRSSSSPPLSAEGSLKFVRVGLRLRLLVRGSVLSPQRVHKGEMLLLGFL